MNNLLVRLCTSSVVLLLVGLFLTPVSAQLPSHLRDYPLGEQKSSGDIVAPIFNGWVENEDGSVRLIFGFANRNTEEIVDIPIGPNNLIEPSQFNGVQPTHFPIYKRRAFIGSDSSCRHPEGKQYPRQSRRYHRNTRCRQQLDHLLLLCRLDSSERSIRS